MSAQLVQPFCICSGLSRRRSAAEGASGRIPHHAPSHDGFRRAAVTLFRAHFASQSLRMRTSTKGILDLPRNGVCGKKTLGRISGTRHDASTSSSTLAVIIASDTRNNTQHRNLAPIRPFNPASLYGPEMLSARLPAMRKRAVCLPETQPNDGANSPILHPEPVRDGSQ